MLLELIIRGITIGLVYALMGVGLALLNGVMRIINFAHGEFYMIGGYMAYYSMTLLGLPFTWQCLRPLPSLFYSALSSRNCS